MRLVIYRINYDVRFKGLKVEGLAQCQETDENFVTIPVHWNQEDLHTD